MGRPLRLARIGSIVAAGFLVGQVAPGQRVLRAGDSLPGMVVEQSDIDPDLAREDSGGRRNDENRRAANRPPRVLKQVPSEYPEQLRGTGAAGEVMLSLMVDRMGRPSHIRVEQSPDELFTDSALDSLAQWEFLPALRNGRVTNSRVRVTIPVSEEMGDSTFFDFAGGRISLEGVAYAGQHEHEVKRLFGLRPVFPFEMLVDAKPGEVVLEFNIDDDGRPYDMTVLEATHQEFSLAAQAAMAHWRFSPALQEGGAVISRLRYRVSFQPDEFPAPVLALARRMHEGVTTDFVPARELDSDPKVIRSMAPSLPKSLEGLEGPRRVVVGIVITANGEVLLPQVKSAPEPLVGYVVATAVSYWKFSPGYRAKQPVQVNVTLPVTF